MKIQAKRFSLAELIVIAAGIAVLAGMIFPVAARAKEEAVKLFCEENLKKLGLASAQYSADNDNFLATDGVKVRFKHGKNDLTDDTWLYKLWTYHRNPELYSCPDAKKWVRLETTNKSCKHVFPGSKICYMVNVSAAGLFGMKAFPMKRTTEMKRPNQTLYLVDNYVRDNFTGNWTCTAKEFSTGISEKNADMVYRHNGAANILFIDGHVGNFKRPLDLDLADSYADLVLNP